VKNRGHRGFEGAFPVVVFILIKKNSAFHAHSLKKERNHGPDLLKQPNLVPAILSRVFLNFLPEDTTSNLKVIKGDLVLVRAGIDLIHRVLQLGNGLLPILLY